MTNLKANLPNDSKLSKFLGYENAKKCLTIPAQSERIWNL